MIDLITDGVPPAALKRKGHVAVYNALVRTAASAQQRGWSRPRWEALVEQRALGRQNRTDARGDPSNPARAQKRLWAAWDAARKWVDEQDEPWSRDKAREHAIELARSLTAVTIDSASDLTIAERILLRFVAQVAIERGSDTLTLSREVLIGGTGLGLTALRTALRGLETRGAFTLATSGERRTKGKPGRANVYRLGSLNQSGEPVSGAPPELAVPSALVPSAVSGAPELQALEGANIDAETITPRTAKEKAAVRRLLAEMRVKRPGEGPAPRMRRRP